jgi:hypothetical protein
MEEAALVHILSATPPHAFIGCGVVIEGGLIATCRHVWRDALKGAAEGAQPMAEFPRVDGDARRQALRLAAACDHQAPPPDLVLLEPAALPSGTPALLLATTRPSEVGNAACRARLSRGTGHWAEITVPGTLDAALDPEGRRQFTGRVSNGYWFARGSSGSPVFQEHARHLAAILSLSEIAAEDDAPRLQEAFVIPGTLIRRHAMRLAAIWAARAIVVDNGRDTRVGAERGKVWPVLLPAQNVHRLHRVGEAHLFQRDRGLMPVGRWPVVEVDHVRSARLAATAAWHAAALSSPSNGLL